MGRLACVFLVLGTAGWLGLPDDDVAAAATPRGSNQLMRGGARRGRVALGEAVEPGPNILLIVTDDQAWSTFNRDLMPAVFTELVDKGVLFTRGYVNTALCCPSRAEILTGLFEHHTGVDRNESLLTRPTIVQALHNAGYRTALFGKYLNSAPCDPRSEFDQWVCRKGYSYQDPLLNVNGEEIHLSGYTMDILANEAATFISSTPADQPFFVLYSPTSPHLGSNYDDRCAGEVAAHRPPSFDEDTMNAGKPEYVQRPPLTAEEIAEIDEEFATMTRMAACLDPAIGSLLASLGDRTQDTMVIYLSDNGFLYREHRWRSKGVPYEESMGVPFIVRYPALVPETGPFQSDALVQNVDIAPTLAELAGFPWGADGTSFLPLLTDEATEVHGAALLEYCQAGGSPCRSPPPFNALATLGVKYVDVNTGEKELYDLSVDPYELDNLAGDPAWAETQAQLAAQLADLRGPPAIETTIVTGPQEVVTEGAYVFTYFSQSRFATYECRLWTNGSPGSWFSCNGESTTVGPLSIGDYLFEVAGTDEFGSADATPAARAFVVADEIAPVTIILSGPPDPSSSASATFSFTADEQDVTFSCSLDASPPVDCESGETYPDLFEGSHSFSVWATDLEGHVGDPAMWSWTVDLTPPALSSLQMFDDDANGRVDRVEATFAEALGPYQAGLAPWTLSQVPSDGTLASVMAVGPTATLALAEGPGPAATEVGGFTVTLTMMSGGIADLAGNLASFPATVPDDRASPVPVRVTDTQGSRNGKIESGDTLTVTFSEPIAPTSVPSETSVTEADPGPPPVHDTLLIEELTSEAISTGSDDYVKRNSRTATFASSTVTLTADRKGITVSVGPSCAGTGCSVLGRGQGDFVFAPSATLTDDAGNPAAGMFAAAAFRIF